MRGIPRPSPAMIVALIALGIAIGGTAAALPGKFTVGRDDLKESSVGARAIGKVMLEVRSVARSDDPVPDDGNFTEVDGEIRCPARAPFAFDPAVGVLGPTAFESKRLSVPNRWGGPLGYAFVILSDDGPNFGYTLTVNCLPAR